MAEAAAPVCIACIAGCAAASGDVNDKMVCDSILCATFCPASPNRTPLPPPPQSGGAQGCKVDELVDPGFGDPVALSERMGSPSIKLKVELIKSNAIILLRAFIFSNPESTLT